MGTLTSHTLSIDQDVRLETLSVPTHWTTGDLPHSDSCRERYPAGSSAGNLPSPSILVPQGHVVYLSLLTHIIKGQEL